MTYILIRPKDYAMGDILWHVRHRQMIKVCFPALTAAQHREILASVPCKTCDANAGQPCVTATGNEATRPHKYRYVTAVAAMYALLDEITISEEPDIEDVLGA